MGIVDNFKSKGEAAGEGFARGVGRGVDRVNQENAGQTEPSGGLSQERIDSALGNAPKRNLWDRMQSGVKGAVGAVGSFFGGESFAEARASVAARNEKRTAVQGAHDSLQSKKKAREEAEQALSRARKELEEDPKNRSKMGTVGARQKAVNKLKEEEIALEGELTDKVKEYEEESSKSLEKNVEGL